MRTEISYKDFEAAYCGTLRALLDMVAYYNANARAARSGLTAKQANERKKLLAAGRPFILDMRKNAKMFRHQIKEPLSASTRRLEKRVDRAMTDAHLEPWRPVLAND